MPTFTSYPDPKVVGSVAQDDKGWSWIYNGSAWDSMGFVKQFNPLAGFEGPFAPDTTGLTTGVSFQLNSLESANGFLLGTSSAPFDLYPNDMSGVWAVSRRTTNYQGENTVFTLMPSTHKVCLYSSL